jgi:hypothetical protein
MEMSGQFHAPTASPPGKEPLLGIFFYWWNVILVKSEGGEKNFYQKLRFFFVRTTPVEEIVTGDEGWNFQYEK